MRRWTVIKKSVLKIKKVKLGDDAEKKAMEAIADQLAYLLAGAKCYLEKL